MIGNHKYIFQNAFSLDFENLENELFQRFSYIGEECLRIARLNGSYTDQTGNLRSSVGYVLTNNGKIWSTGGFNPSENSGTDGEEGAEDGLSVALEKISEIPSGYALIFVAGMEYASYVEKKNFDVLTYTESEARQIADSILKDIAKRV